jgi:hypothetical protein
MFGTEGPPPHGGGPPVLMLRDVCSGAGQITGTTAVAMALFPALSLADTVTV